jgi:hypothetical protein
MKHEVHYRVHRIQMNPEIEFILPWDVMLCDSVQSIGTRVRWYLRPPLSGSNLLQLNYAVNLILYFFKINFNVTLPSTFKPLKLSLSQ